MNGKIDSEGKLNIERAGLMDRVGCPFSSDFNHSVYCGDWCAKFGEPTPAGNPNNPNITITICNGQTHRFDRFADEREDETE